MSAFFDDLFSIESIEETESGFTAYLLCNPSHPVYRAHFPGSPITPGACLLQTATLLLRQRTGRPFYLESSKNIKYLNVLIPEEGKTVHFEFSHFTETETACKVQLVVADETSAYSKMSLLFSHGPV